MERSLHNENERFDDLKAERADPLTDRRIFDFILHRILYAAGSSPNVKVANGVAAYFPDDSGLVEYVSGDRGTGVTFKINAGVGFKKFSSGQPDEDHPQFLPICIDADDSFVTNGSDPTNPRKDRVFLKPAYADENQQSVDIIDPVTKNITSESRYTNRAYRYEFQYVAGTPAPSPDPPDPPSGYTAQDAICEILIQPGSGAFNPDDLDDLRTLLEACDQLVPAVTSLPADQITVDPVVMGESDAQAALEALETQLGAQLTKGLLVGKLEYINTQSMKLERVLGLAITIEIDGEILTKTSPITWDITSDLESGQTESASTWYYLYVYNSSGTILQKISETPPQSNPANKMGYHPTNTGWRCVGSWYNDSSSNLEPALVSGGWVKYWGQRAWRYHGLGTTIPTGWTLAGLDLPETADKVLLIGVLAGMRAVSGYGQSDASVAMSDGGTLSSAGDAVAILPHGQDDGGDRMVAEFELSIVDPTNPGFKWSNRQVYGGANITAHEVRVQGYFDRFAPRY